VCLLFSRAIYFLVGVVLCPIDRQPTPINEIDVKQLTPNFALIDLLRQLMAEASDENKNSSKLGSCKVCYQVHPFFRSFVLLWMPCGFRRLQLSSVATVRKAFAKSSANHVQM